MDLRQRLDNDSEQPAFMRPRVVVSGCLSREHFLTRLFAPSRLRAVGTSGAMRKLVAFQTAYKLVLTAYVQDAMRELGRIVANAERRLFPAVVDPYREAFARALHEPPRYTAVVNVLEHAWGPTPGTSIRTRRGLTPSGRGPIHA